MSGTARLEVDGNVYELDTFVGSEGERAIDISKLGIERFTLCDTPTDQPLRLYFGR